MVFHVNIRLPLWSEGIFGSFEEASLMSHHQWWALTKQIRHSRKQDWLISCGFIQASELQTENGETNADARMETLKWDELTATTEINITLTKPGRREKHQSYGRGKDWERRGVKSSNTFFLKNEIFYTSVTDHMNSLHDQREFKLLLNTSRHQAS